MPCCLRHTSLFTRCGTTACVPFLSVDVNRDLFPINTILILLFSHFTCLLPNKSFQSRLFRLYCSIVFYCAHLHQLALLRIQERISVQGSFRTCWEWKRVLEEEKKEKRPLNEKSTSFGLILQNQGLCLDPKKRRKAAGRLFP